MTLKKRLIVAGLLCSFGTTNVTLSDDANPSNSLNSPNQPQVPAAPTATAPPVLFAPSASAKPLPIKAGSPTRTDSSAKIVSPATKLSTAVPLSIVISSKPVATVLPKSEASPKKFVSLLQGDELEGWVVQEGRLEVWSRDGDTISCNGAGGGWLRTEKEYSDFHLKFEYRLAAGANSGLGFRSPEEGNPTFTGIELQFLDDTSPKYSSLRAEQYTGSLYYHAAPTQKPQLNSADEWNSCEVICKGDQVLVKINAKLVNEVNLAKPREDSEKKKGAVWQLAKRPPTGHIALQSSSSKVDFRNLELKDLTVNTACGVKYVDLVVGEGETLSEAKKLTVHYIGQLLDGTRFGDTRDLGNPIIVPIEGVIDGWKHGIEGMKVGGRRRLIVPPDMAYGSQGVANLIPPEATLVFEVELRGFER